MKKDKSRVTTLRLSRIEDKWFTGAALDMGIGRGELMRRAAKEYLKGLGIPASKYVNQTLDKEEQD